MDAAKIYGYATSMFEFARRETDIPPRALDWDKAISGLNLRNMWKTDYPELHAFVLRARDRHNAIEQP